METSRIVAAIALATCFVVGRASITEAAFDDDTFEVSITIQAECEITSVGDISFGANGVLSATVAATATLQIQCTDTTGYSIALNEGTGIGATIGARLMTNLGTSKTVTYSLYKDAGHTQLWGDTGGQLVAGTGNGDVVAYTIYGLVPVQVTPQPDLYEDDITVTITF